MLRNFKISDRAALGLAAIAVLIFHWTLIRQDVLLTLDDLALTNPLRATTSLSEYFKNLVTGVHLDLQPVRDLTFYLNLKLESLTGWAGFHLFNVILSWLILWKLDRVLKQQAVSENIRALIILFIALHPLYNVITAWTSNRKHLLAVFFILFYLGEWLKDGRQSLRGLLYCMLSFLSQPIAIFIPVLAVGFDMWKSRKVKWIDGFILLTCLGVLLSNYYFYRTMPAFAARNATVSFWNLDWVLGLGRMFSQVYAPLSFAIEYDIGHVLSLVGLGIGVAAALLLYKLKPSLRSLVLLLMGLSTLYPVISFGARSPYGLSFLLVCAVFTITSLRPRWMFALPILVLLSYQSFKFTSFWESDEKLVTSSYEIEGGAFNLMGLAFYYRFARPEYAYQLSVDLRKLYPGGESFTLAQLVAESFYYSRHKSPVDKLKIYKESPSTEEFHLFFKRKFLIDQGRTSEAKETEEILLRNFLVAPNIKDILTSNLCRFYPDDCRQLDMQP